jgi:hypothetical protein
VLWARVTTGHFDAAKTDRVNISERASVAPSDASPTRAGLRGQSPRSKRGSPLA